MFKTLCTKEALSFMPTFEWMKSERYMMSSKMLHEVSTRQVPKICKQLQKLLTGVRDWLS